MPTMSNNTALTLIDERLKKAVDFGWITSECAETFYKMYEYRLENDHYDCYDDFNPKVIVDNDVVNNYRADDLSEYNPKDQQTIKLAWDEWSGDISLLYEDEHPFDFERIEYYDYETSRFITRR